MVQDTLDPGYGFLPTLSQLGHSLLSHSLINESLLSSYYVPWYRGNEANWLRLWSQTVGVQAPELLYTSLVVPGQVTLNFPMPISSSIKWGNNKPHPLDFLGGLNELIYVKDYVPGT